MTPQLQQQFAHYSQSHQHPSNLLIHAIAVPLIYLSVLGLLWAIPLPYGSNAAWLGIAITCGFYLRHSLSLCLGILALSALAVLGCALLQQQNISVALTSLAIFIVAWLAQFIGHAIEGKKPSFFEDLSFLLVGPGWVLAKLYRRLHIPV
ncbi:DUF962 domain-containing protein [Dasania sp. GY-MA-18]|uniref:DUF962 domain-containing protein n=1 Tax=Dasania phycosphaerae TaxID=2950436 RepID=A0A9J6RI93_9GAMM|nr:MULTISPECIES: Mpo1-like protein [Dasania]MCR8921556.1 DUF962 domain-containing protein [Dasania sp. GY-MA-18]MCZ0863984.1 DUF962 domain-containing protein [Dasania phycosphaerae]MCZ0867712.1 DUF962 domain-containing protein [Dasania phycosphaerae]